MAYDKINENTISATFLREYITNKGVVLDDKTIERLSKEAYALDIGFWSRAKTITIPALKAILEEVKLDFHTFIDDYAEHLKSL